MARPGRFGARNLARSSNAISSVASLSASTSNRKVYILNISPINWIGFGWVKKKK